MAEWCASVASQPGDMLTESNNLFGNLPLGCQRLNLITRYKAWLESRRGKIKVVVEAAMKKGAPIRIGVNSGSLEKDLLEKYGHATPEAMVESAMRHVEIHCQDFQESSGPTRLKPTD